MAIIANYSSALLFLAVMLFIGLFTSIVALLYLSRKDPMEGLYLLRSSINVLNNEKGSIGNQSRREFPRMYIEGLRADISDGMASYSGLVTNISAHGLCLHDVPDKLSSSRSLLSIVVRSEVENYRIVARPRWMIVQDNRGKTLGVEIASSPTSWNDFVHSR